MIYILIFLFNGWSYERIGSGNSSFQGVRAGYGRNDSVIRIYGGCDDHHAYEYTYDDTGWIKVDMGSATGQIHGVFVGAGRNDDTLRVYGSVWSENELLEFTFRNGAWEGVVIGNPGNYNYEPPVGYGRNDDTLRVYTGLNGGSVYEFTYRGGVWDKEYVGGASGSDNSVHDLWIDKGRNDDTFRIYAVNTDGKLWEFSYDGEVWNSSIVAIHNDIAWGVVAGDGRNDGVKRLYVCTGADPQHGGSNQGQIFEYTWNGNGWDSSYVGIVPKHLYGLTVGQARNDGINRIYTGCADGYVYEFTYDDTGWVKENIGGPGNTWFHDAVVSRGRNDDTLRLYVAAGDRHIYEFTYRPDSKVLVEPNQEDSTFGNVPVKFQFYVHNSGTVDEPINLKVQSTKNWSVSLLDSLDNNFADTDGDGNPDPGIVRTSDSFKVYCEVLPPGSVNAGENDTIFLYGYSHYYPAIYDSAMAVLIIKEQSELQLYPDQIDTVLPGRYIDYKIWVKNDGNHDELVNLWERGLLNDWGIEYLDEQYNQLTDSDQDGNQDVSVGSYGDSIPLFVRVTSSDSAIAFIAETLTVVGEGATVSDGVNLITYVAPVPVVDIESDQIDTSYAGESIEYPLSITNNGNAIDCINVVVKNGHNWNYELLDTAGVALEDHNGDLIVDVDSLLYFGNRRDFNIRIEIPRNTPHETFDTTIIYGISSIDESVKDSVILITEVFNPFDTLYSVVCIPDTTGYIEKGDTAIYPVKVINTSNIPVDFTVQVITESDWKYVLMDKDNVVFNGITPLVGVGDTFNLYLGVIPPDTLGSISGMVDTVSTAEHKVIANKFSISDTADIVTIFVPEIDIHNYPNPFNNRTTFIFNIPEDGDARLNIYTRNGEYVTTIFDKFYKMGVGYKAGWDGRNYSGKEVSPGVYIYILRFKGKSRVKYIRKKAMKE